MTGLIGPNGAGKTTMFNVITGLRAVTDEIVQRVGIGHVADDRVDAMPTGLARLVELGRALATHPRPAPSRRAGFRTRQQRD